MNTEFDESEAYLDWYPFPKSRMEYARFFLGLEAADRKADLPFTDDEAFRWFAEIEAKVRRVHLRLFWKVFAVVFVLWTVLNGASTIACKDAGFTALRVAIMFTGSVFVATILGYCCVAILGSFPLDEDGRILPWEVVPKDEDDRDRQAGRKQPIGPQSAKSPQPRSGEDRST